jgi:hypothetical protein
MIESVLTFLVVTVVAAFVGGLIFIAVVMFLEDLND